jgi:RHS repeat-associated protein
MPIRIERCKAAGSNTYDYDANGNMKTRNGSTISCTSYNLPTSIPSGTNSSTLAYGAWRNTVKQVAVNSGTTETTVYVAGLLEKVTKGTTTEYRHRIDATPGTVAIYVRKSSGSNATYYLHRDHLGSPEMITNASGTSVVKLSFSAYGERRDVDWDGPITSSHLTSTSNVTRHGFTDHLHLDSVKLVHMGGRVYDPVIGRFLSRDPYIDGVASSQGANGYAYVWNNPLSRWDPTGFTSTIPGRDYRLACNSGDCVNGSGLERITVTGTRPDPPPLASALTPLDAAALRLGHIGTGGTSGDGVESGGTGDTVVGPANSTGDSPQGTLAAEMQACNGNWSCQRRVANDARAAGMALPPDILQVFKDIGKTNITVLRVFTPEGRLAGGAIDSVRIAYDMSRGDSRWVGNLIGAAFVFSYSRVLSPVLGTEYAGRVGEVVGIFMEPVAQDAFAPKGQ